jgi:hypothetical protein
MTEFIPFMHKAGDLYQRIGGPSGFHWRHISRDMAWSHIVDLMAEAAVAEGIGDKVHAVRLANDANCLLEAVCDHDQWVKASAPYPANDRFRETA